MINKKLKMFSGSILLSTAILLSGCGTTAETATDVAEATDVTGEINETIENEGETQMSNSNENIDYKEYFNGIEKSEFYKGLVDSNPIMTQRFGADPYALVYGDTVYFYMTADTPEFDAAGNPKENTYSAINTINVVSTKDMVNFTDHGEIKVAGSAGAATWARNSWAPAAAWKTIDGKDKFFLYFADGGGGIGVLEADSPVGPFTDPIGHGLITRNTPTCDTVAWLFDPAVLVDDDGNAYVYFGGGVPEGKASAPGTGRVAKLGADMISLDGDPVAIDIPYLFEDSGIHKYGNKYYYTYCTNFTVDQAGTDKYGFRNGEIAVLVSDNPMGPFVYQERILRNPGDVFGLSGNNHHAVFNFKDQWYITYHTRVLEQNIGVENGYRCTFVTDFEMGEDGIIGLIPMSKTGREQIEALDPYQTVNATTSALLAGVYTTETAEGCVLTGMDCGGFVKVQGVDFGNAGATKVVVSVRETAADTFYGRSSIAEFEDKTATSGKLLQFRVDNLRGNVLGTVDMSEVSGTDFAEITINLDETATGEHDLYLLFDGCGYDVLSWRFE